MLQKKSSTCKSQHWNLIDLISSKIIETIDRRNKHHNNIIIFFSVIYNSSKSLHRVPFVFLAMQNSKWVIKESRVFFSQNKNKAKKSSFLAKFIIGKSKSSSPSSKKISSSNNEFYNHEQISHVFTLYLHLNARYMRGFPRKISLTRVKEENISMLVWFFLFLTFHDIFHNNI